MEALLLLTCLTLHLLPAGTSSFGMHPADEPAGPISEWITAAPPPDPEPVEDQGKPAPTAAQGPVSKWTLVDYDDEDAQRAHDAG